MVQPLPDGRYLEVVSMLGKRDVLLSLEKTAEVSTKLYTREGAIVDQFFKLAFRRVPEVKDQRSMIKMAGEALARGGADLVRAANLSADLSALSETLEKLGAIGELNAKLQLAVDSDELDDEAKNQAIKLGSENSRLCLETLQELVKYADGMKGNLGSTMPTSAATAAAGSMRSAFGGSGGPGLSMPKMPAFGASLGSSISSGLKKLTGR